MSYVTHRVAELRADGFIGADKVDPLSISKVVNMREEDYYAIESNLLESYMGMLSQQIHYIQQECNIAEAKEIESGNDFKLTALPLIFDAKIRSVEERWLFASTLTPELKMKFDFWQRCIIDCRLKKGLDSPLLEKLNVLKKIYDERRMDGKNRNIHKYTDGSMGSR